MYMPMLVTLNGFYDDIESVQALFEIMISRFILFPINSLSFFVVVVTAMRNQQQ